MDARVQCSNRWPGCGCAGACCWPHSCHGRPLLPGTAAALRAPTPCPAASCFLPLFHNSVPVWCDVQATHTVKAGPPVPEQDVARTIFVLTMAGLFWACLGCRGLRACRFGGAAALTGWASQRAPCSISACCFLTANLASHKDALRCGQKPHRPLSGI